MDSITFHIGEFHHIDPNIDPADYSGWGVSGLHVWLVDSGNASSNYLAKLILALFTAGAKEVSYV